MQDGRAGGFKYLGDTPRKTNMELENEPLDFWKPSLLGSMLVFGGVIHFDDDNFQSG